MLSYVSGSTVSKHLLKYTYSLSGYSSYISAEYCRYDASPSSLYRHGDVSVYLTLKPTHRRFTWPLLVGSRHRFLH